MTGETSIGGVFLPTLLLLAIVALVASAVVIRLLGRINAYRFVSYKALVDLAIFVLVLGGIFFFATEIGIHP